MSRFGFTQVTIGDHDLAAFLRRVGAIDDWRKTGTANTWFAPDATAVAQVHYNGVGGMDTKTFIRDDLVATAHGAKEVE